MEEKSKLLEAQQLKQFTFFGVAVSTIAALTSIVAVPMLCVHLQNVQSGIQEELNYCRLRNDGMRSEVHKVTRFVLYCLSCLIIFHLHS